MQTCLINLPPQLLTKPLMRVVARWQSSISCSARSASSRSVIPLSWMSSTAAGNLWDKAHGDDRDDEAVRQVARRFLKSLRSER